jgi:tetratricopeptide (TPR) repeat protein
MQPQTTQDWLEAGIAHFNAFDQEVLLDPNEPVAFLEKGVVFERLHQPTGALAASSRTLELDPTSANAYLGKGTALRDLKRFEEALAAYECALELEPTAAHAFHGKGRVLNDPRRRWRRWIAP